jgi:thymidine phosphorylase
VIDDPGLLPRAKLVETWPAPRPGFVSAVDARAVAHAAVRLGAGRSRAEDVIDPAVGIAGLVKVGERVAAGHPLAEIHANDPAALADARALLAGAFTLADAPVSSPPLVAEVIAE